MDIDPPEVGILYLEEAGYVSGTNPAPTPKKLFVDIINRSPEGVGIQTEKEIEPATVFICELLIRQKKHGICLKVRQNGSFLV